MKRREFLKTGAFGAAGAAELFLRGTNRLRADELGADALPTDSAAALDEDRVMIFSDTHVSPDGYMRPALEKRIAALLAMRPLPANLLIYGDFAHFYGKEEDYVVLREVMKPIEAAGIRWNLAFGNHDRREAFFRVFPERRQTSPAVEGRFVTEVETPCADFILLDSLVEGEGQGAIDDAQKDWLDRRLGELRKPVFVGAHHPLNETRIDEILLRHGDVVAGYIHGHYHFWLPKREGNLPILGLPSTGYWGDIGYVELELSPNEARFRLQMLDYFNPRPLPEPKPEWLAEIEKKKGAELTVPLVPVPEAERAALPVFRRFTPPITKG